MYLGNHNCQINSDKTEMLFYPGENYFVRLLCKLRMIFMISDKNPNCKKYIRSRAYIIYEKRRHLKYYKYSIHPFSLFSFCWDIYMMLSVIGLIYIPYHSAFSITSTNSWSLLCFKNFLLLSSWCDILVNFCTGYLDMKENFVEMSHRQIINRYIFQGTFVPDLLASIPTDLFFINRWKEYAILRELLSFIYVFRCFSTYKYMRKLTRAFDLQRHQYEFWATIFWLMIILHWQSCIFWIVPLAAVSLGQPVRPKNKSWINLLNLWNPSKKNVRYYQSIYRSVVTFTRSGFSEAEPQTSEDQCTVIILQVICTFAICMLVANMMQFFRGVNSSRLKYQLNCVRLKEYMQHKQLDHHLQRKINNYYDYKYKKHYFKEAEILSNFSDKVRQEIRMYSCRKLVENVYFFHDLPMSMLIRIVTLLKSEIFLTNDLIVKANQIGDCMYFIATGTVAVYTSSGKEVCHLESGTHFGEIALVMPDARRVATVVAVEVCKLYRLERADFIRTIHPYPLLWDRIKKIAYERVERTAMLNVQ